MFLKRFKPILPLQPYISRIWVFENHTGIPSDDAKLIAPNGCMKLIVPYKKRVTSYIGKTKTDHPPMSCIVVGQQTSPVNIETEVGGGTIGIEFKAFAASRFLQDRLNLLTNQVCSIQEAWGAVGVRMQEQLSNIANVECKVECLQKYLLGIFSEKSANPVVEYAVKQIGASSGFISILRLSEEIGLSRQHITRLFKENVGISPKELSRIARFQRFYRLINKNPNVDYFDEIYDYYYDQSHFIKEFQKFSGLTPNNYAKLRNEFGKIFYRGDTNVPFIQ